MDHKREKTFQDYLAILWRRRLFIAGALALALVGALLYLVTAPPLYRSTARILVHGSDDAQNREASEILRGLLANIAASDVATQVEYLESARLSRD
jgi:uncharacterized protein involved in exopolysaccharide biosynthesis